MSLIQYSETYWKGNIIMAISASTSILAMLKVWYKDGIESLMFRNSPVLKELKKTRVEGKSQNFSTIVSSGGAVSGDFTKAKTQAAENLVATEFAVEPGQIFSCFSLNAKEVQASLSRKGAYMKVAGAKMFSASEGFRKTMAAALYGRGYGELCLAPATTLTAATAATMTLPGSAIMKIDVGSKLAVVASLGATPKNTLTVTSINGNVITVLPELSANSLATDIICINGAQDSSGNPLLPVGLSGWLPTVSSRTGAAWNTYIATPFFGVNRSIAADRLGGQYVKGTASDTISSLVQSLILKCRRAGSKADMIVMNDNDFLALSKEIESTNTFFTQTSTKGVKEANVGFNKFAASFSTNYIENIYDDPYCPEGRIYCLDKEGFELFTYTNADVINDGIVGNEAGKANPIEGEAFDSSAKPYQLIIDDFINVEPGTGSVNGPDQLVTLQMFGSFVATNPSILGVAETASCVAV